MIWRKDGLAQNKWKTEWRKDVEKVHQRKKSKHRESRHVASPKIIDEVSEQMKRATNVFRSCVASPQEEVARDEQQEQSDESEQESEEESQSLTKGSPKTRPAYPCGSDDISIAHFGIDLAPTEALLNEDISIPQKEPDKKRLLKRVEQIVERLKIEERKAKNKVEMERKKLKKAEYQWQETMLKLKNGKQIHKDLSSA